MKIEKATVADLVAAKNRDGTMSEDELAHARTAAAVDLADVIDCKRKYAEYGIEIHLVISVNTAPKPESEDVKARKAWSKDWSKTGKHLAESAPDSLPDIKGVTSPQGLLKAVVDHAAESDLSAQPKVALIIQDAEHRAARAAEEENHGRVHDVQVAYEELKRNNALTIEEMRGKAEKACRGRSAATVAALRLSRKARQESLLRVEAVLNHQRLSDRYASLAKTHASLEQERDAALRECNREVMRRRRSVRGRQKTRSALRAIRAGNRLRAHLNEKAIASLTATVLDRKELVARLYRVNRGLRRVVRGLHGDIEEFRLWTVELKAAGENFKAERDKYKVQRDQYKAERDHFNGLFTEAKNNLVKANLEIESLEARGKAEAERAEEARAVAVHEAREEVLRSPTNFCGQIVLSPILIPLFLVKRVVRRKENHQNVRH